MVTVKPAKIWLHLRSFEMYKLCKSPDSGELAPCVERLMDKAFIPFDPANTDYQAFLQWIAEGNEPLPPDAPATE